MSPYSPLSYRIGYRRRSGTETALPAAPFQERERTNLLSTLGFPPCKAFRSWLIPFMTPVLWRGRPNASRVGFRTCDPRCGLAGLAYDIQMSHPIKSQGLLKQLPIKLQELARISGAGSPPGASAEKLRFNCAGACTAAYQTGCWLACPC